MRFKWRPADAFTRAGRRWSPWRILAVPLGFACAVAVFLFVADMTLRALILFGPDNVIFCTPTHVSAIILFLALAVLSVPAGLVIANLLLWTIRPIRAALERADARAGQSFATANAQLVNFAMLSALILLPIYVIALGSKDCLSDSEIYYRPHLLASQQTYALSQVAEVRPRCTKGTRGGWDIGLDLAMNDGASFDLAVIGPWFSSSSDRILTSLRGLRSNDSRIHSDCPIGLRKLVSP